MAETVNNIVGRIQNLVPGIDTQIPVAADNSVNVLVIGNPQQNLFGVMNEIFGGLDPLDSPMMSGYRGTIVYGDSNSVFKTDNGSPEAVDMNVIAEDLKKYNKNSVQHRFTVALNNPKLKDCAIHVLASDLDFEDINWNAELSKADYVLLTMNSTALLSMAERKAIRNWLAPYASDAYGIILTNDNLILEDDREDIDESLNSMFHGSVGVFRMPETDAEKLADLLNTLKTKATEIHEKRDKRAERLLLINAKKAVELQLKVFSENKADIEASTEAIKESVQKLPGRQQAAFRYARIQHISSTKIEASEMINDFQRQLDEKLNQEIEQDENPDEMSEILPSYIADAWRSEANLVFEMIQGKMAAMQRDLQAYIDRDIRNYIEGCVGGDTADYVYALLEKYFKIEDTFVIQDGDNQFLYDAPKDNTKAKYYGAIASGIALILFSHPIIGIAVATIGSKKIRKNSVLQLDVEKKKALIQASEELNKEYFSDMQTWIEELFDSVEDNIRASIDDCYQKMIDQIVQSLNKRVMDQNSYEEKLAELQALKQEIDNRLA